MRVFAICQDELLIRSLDAVLLPSFDVDFLVESRPLARRLHDIHGAVEATGDGHEPDGRRAGGERAADRDRAAGDRQKERDAGHPARIAAAARRPANGARLRPA